MTSLLNSGISRHAEIRQWGWGRGRAVEQWLVDRLRRDLLERCHGSSFHH